MLGSALFYSLCLYVRHIKSGEKCFLQHFSQLKHVNHLSLKAIFFFNFIEGRQLSMYRFPITPLTGEVNVQLVTLWNRWGPDINVDVIHIPLIQTHSCRDLYRPHTVGLSCIFLQMPFFYSELSHWVTLLNKIPQHFFSTENSDLTVNSQ